MPRSTLILVVAALLAVMVGAVLIAQNNTGGPQVVSDEGTRVEAPGTRVESDRDGTRIQAPGVDITVPRDKDKDGD